MLPKENRLKKENDFDKVFKEGKGLKDGLLRLKIKENGFDFTRFGFIVSKKYSKRASERNSIKRKLREITRKLLPEIKKGFDIVMLVMPGIENDFNILTETVTKLLKKAKLLNENNE